MPCKNKKKVKNVKIINLGKIKPNTPNGKHGDKWKITQIVNICGR
jgi:hypothetical protein